jgi:hydroxymethylbilane synthase
MAETVLTIGSRGSALALWQANYVAARLKALGIAARIEVIKTMGDHLQTASMAQSVGCSAGSAAAVLEAGGKGLFTKEIEEALLDGRIDLAVHSLKDLPTEIPPGLEIAAIPERENPYDAMVGLPLKDLPQGALIGTSSERRASQLHLLRPDLRMEPIRGNVDTRLRKVREGQYAASLLAVSGLTRLGWQHEIAQVLTADEMIPAPGQGALGIETRDAGQALLLCHQLDHVPARQEVECERALLGALGGGCQLPVGALARVEHGRLKAEAIAVKPRSLEHVRAEISGAAADAARLGRDLAEQLLDLGAREILKSL